MTRFFVLALLAGSLNGRAESPVDPRRAMADGEKALARSNRVEAAQHFARAAESAGVERLDPAVPHYNRGIALLGDSQAGPAAEAFQLATRTTDLEVQQRALFNRGNALLKLAGELEMAGQQQPALQNIEEALAMYEQAMVLRPQDPDPKVNYELATREKERLQELIQQQPPSSPENPNQDQEKDQDKEQPPQQQDEQKPPPESGSKQQPPQADEQQEQKQDASPNQDASKPDESTSSGAPQEMTREEATRLLDAMKEQEQANREQMARERMRMNMGQLPPVEKDW
jgi:Ca-activated chloride channel family protein